MEDVDYSGSFESVEDDNIAELKVGAADDSKQDSKIKVTDITITPNGPQLTPEELKNPEIAALLPKVNIFTNFSCILHNVNNAIANGLRRVCMLDLKIKYLDFEHKSYVTTDRYLLYDYIQRRMNLIPLKQTVPANVKFSLFVKNTEPYALRVYTRDIKSSDGKKYFNENIELCTVKANLMLKIDNIVVASDYGFNNACAAGCIHGVSIPLDIEMLNMYTRTGVSSTVANPRKYALRFDTNGTVDPKELVRRACDRIIERSDFILQTSLTVATSESGEFIIHVIGEDDTIGNLYMRTIADEYPNIRNVSYTVNDKNRSMTLTINSIDDAKDVVKHANSIIANRFVQIKKYFE